MEGGWDEMVMMMMKKAKKRRDLVCVCVLFFPGWMTATI